MSRSLPLLAAVILTSLCFVPGALAHGAPNPLDNEVMILHDEANDGFLVADGYDLYTLLVREAYWAPTDEHGLIFRFQILGGSSNPAIDAQHIDLIMTTSEGDKTFRMTTTDDVNWETELTIVAQESEADIGQSWDHEMQVLVSYDQLNATIGDEVSDIRMLSWIDDQIVDTAPGGFYLPGAETNANVDAEPSVRYIENMTLAGPQGYTKSTAHGNGTQLELEVKSLITVSGQHLAIVVPPDQPWTWGDISVDNPNLPEGGNKTIRFNAEPIDDGVAPLVIHIDTDTGGRETLLVSYGPRGFYETKDGALVELALPEAVESSAYPAWTLLVLMGAILLVRRRQ